jgi:hypothetical protein
MAEPRVQSVAATLVDYSVNDMERAAVGHIKSTGLSLAYQDQT